MSSNSLEQCNYDNTYILLQTRVPEFLNMLRKNGRGNKILLIDYIEISHFALVLISTVKMYTAINLYKNSTMLR